MTKSTHSVIVTGGAGFIGSELTAQLVAAGRRVVVLDNLSAGRRQNLEALPADSVRLVEGDIRDRGLVASLLEDVSLVFHLACVNLRQAIKTPLEAYDVNASATRDLLLAAQAAGVPRFVHVSSSEVYGSGRSASIDEDHPTLPTTAYGASKLAGEAYARACWTTNGYPTVIVRPFNSFGPRSHHEGTSGEVIPRFVLRALAGAPLVIFGDGTQTRDFTEVTDTARGILLAGSAEAAIGRTINIGSGRAVSVLALADAVKAIAGRPHAAVMHLPPRPGDVDHQCADAALAQRLIGFEPRVSLEQGLESLVEWYRRGAIEPSRLLEDEVLVAWRDGTSRDAAAV